MFAAATPAAVRSTRAPRRHWRRPRRRPHGRSDNWRARLAARLGANQPRIPQSAHRQQSSGAAWSALRRFDRPHLADARRRRRRAWLRRHRHSRFRRPPGPLGARGRVGLDVWSLLRLEIKVHRLELDGLDLRLQVRPDGALSIAAAADADAAMIDLPAPLPPGAEFDGGAGFRTGRDRPDRRDDRRQPGARPRQSRQRPPRSAQRGAGQAHGLRRFPIDLRAVQRDGVDLGRGEGAARALERRSAGPRRLGADGVADRARSRFRRPAALQRQPAAVRSRHADLAAPRGQARRQFGDRDHGRALHVGRRLFQARRPRSRAVLH